MLHSEYLFFVLVIEAFLLGACVSHNQESALLFGDIKSYASLDATKTKYGLFDIEAIPERSAESFVKIAYSKYRFFQGRESLSRFLFFNDRLMEVHFFIDDYVGVINEYFPQINNKHSMKYEDDILVLWLSRDIEMGRFYIGIADSRLREEYKKQLSP